MVDVIIIGAGVIGCAIAKELSKYELKVVVVEKEEDVACGASKANSGIVHAGFDPKPGTLKAKLNVEGNPLIYSWCEELDVPCKKTGSLVVALNNEEVETIEELYKRGKTNGVPGLEIITRDQILEMEPNLNPQVKVGLYAPTAGIVCPYEFTIALAENANMNGVGFLFNSPVVDIIVENGQVKAVRTKNGYIQTRFVINAAGVYADLISEMAGAEKYHIKARKGEYLLFDRELKDLVKRPIFPTPTKVSKGILVCPTVDGNTFIGPNANDVEDKEDVSVTQFGIDEIVSGARKLIPNLPLRHVITSFAGLRAVADTDDFIIGASRLVKGFINVGGIQSPGLTSSPAIAHMVIDILKEEGLKLREEKNYIPGRPKKYRFRDMSNEERKRVIFENSAFGHIVCRCETVTEAEIVDAIRRPVGARSLDAVKRRTRAGMGRCQGGFCSPKVVEILAKELGVDPLEITKKGPGSDILLGHIKDFIEDRGGEEDGE